MVDTEHDAAQIAPPSPLFRSCCRRAAQRCVWLVKMATGGVSGDELRKELTCAICLDFFKDPVILKCGHNFCRFCICMHWDENGDDYGYQCPQCRTVMFEVYLQNLCIRLHLFRKMLVANVTVCLRLCACEVEGVKDNEKKSWLPQL